MPYIPPLKDMFFVLEDIIAIDILKSYGAYKDLNPELIEQVLKEAGRFLAEQIAPLNHSGDIEASRFQKDKIVTPKGFKAAYQKFVENRWQGLSCSEAYGGMGMPRVIGSAFNEILHSANMSFGLAPLLTASAIDAIEHHGSKEQKTLYLPKLVSGEWTGAMDLTEPQSGSDLSNLKTRAEPDHDNSYRLYGQKIYITWGEHDLAENIIHLVLARLPDAPKGVKGISLFLVPKFIPDKTGKLTNRNDIKLAGIEHKMGIHASPTCTLIFGENKGAKAWLIGEENKGLSHMFTMMNAARLGVGLQGVGIAERAYQKALLYAKEREQGKGVLGADKGKIVPIIQHPDVRRMLLTMKAKIQAARCLCYACALSADGAEYADEEEDSKILTQKEAILTPIAKAWSTEIAQEITSLAIQIHGGMGFIEETGIAQYYRDARITPIYEGTNGIQAIDLVRRKLPLDNGLAVQNIIVDIQETAENCALSSHPELPYIARRLEESAHVLETAILWFLEGKQSESDLLTGAAPFLRLFGNVLGGYYLAIGALAARRKQKLNQGDHEDHIARIKLARWYSETVLAECAGLLPNITAGSDLLFSHPVSFL